MPLSPSQRAALRAKKKKAIANGNTNFKPRGENNKAEFEALKKQAQTTETTTTTNIVSAESPPQKRMKITGGASHISDSASSLEINPSTTNDILDEKWETHREKIKKREEQMKKELSKPTSIPLGVPLKPKTKALMDGTVDEFATPTSQFYAMFAKSRKENPILSLEDAKYDKDSEDDMDSVCESPPCPVDHMN